MRSKANTVFLTFLINTKYLAYTQMLTFS